jgi:dCMP deaminase
MDAYANACKSKQSLEGCDLYVTLLPCNECAKNIVRAGVKKIYYLEDKHPEQEVFIASKKYFKLLGKKVTLEQIKL